MICLLHLFFIKCSSNLFTFKITNNICPWHSAFKSFNHKHFFRPTWSVAFCKKVFIFWYSCMVINISFRFFFIFSLPESKYKLIFTSAGFILICYDMYCCIYYLCHLIYQYTHFVIIESHCAKSVQIRSYFWSVFPLIRTEYREIRSINFEDWIYLNNFIWTIKPRVTK